MIDAADTKIHFPNLPSDSAPPNKLPPNCPITIALENSVEAYPGKSGKISWK